MASISINGNVATFIDLPAGAAVDITAKTNSSRVQMVRVVGDGGISHGFQGSGERNTIMGATRDVLTATSTITATFEFSPSAGASAPSKLRAGAPYTIGSTNMLMVVAENGDDSDYNDAILQVSWTTPKA